MKGLLLLSGGIDSPVAGYIMKKQGVELKAVHFSNEPFTDAGAEKKSAVLAQKLGFTKFIVVPFGDIQAEVVKNCTHKYFYVLTRRLMLRISEKILKKEKCDFIVTGENLGQVGSQTLKNMAVITQSIKTLILRPLLTNDKQETIDIANEIKTYEISKGPEICSLLGPKHPATRSRIEDIEIEEKRLDIDNIVKKGFESRKEIF